MDCRELIERLDELLEGSLREPEREAAERHLLRCAQCRAVAAMFDEELGDLSAAPPQDLPEAILARTSGSTCDSARDRLCDHLDAQLDPPGAELVAMHLGACPDCAALSRVLVSLRADLPLLAELETDDRFVEEVLARSLPRRRFGRAVDLFQRLLQRPRIAWEVAYVGALVFALLFSMPQSPLAGVPDRVVRSVPAPRGGELRESMARMTRGAQSAWRTTGSHAADGCRSVALEFDRLSDIARQEIERSVGTLAERLTSKQETDEPESSTDKPEPKQGDES